jgi:glutamate racemase
LRQAGCTRVVLGCTHYPLLAEAIRDAVGDAVRLLDPADAVAAQAERLARDLRAPAADAALLAWSNGEPALLRRVAAACALPIEGVLELPRVLAEPMDPRDLQQVL